MVYFSSVGINVRSFLVGLLASSIAATAANAQEGSGFEAIGKAIEDQISLKVKADRFQVDFPDDRESAQAIYMQLSSLLFGGGGGGGGSTWNYHAGGPYSEAYFEVRRGDNRNRMVDLDSLIVQENIHPFRELNVRKFSDQLLTSLASDLINQELVWLVQEKDKPIAMYYVKGERAGRVTGATVTELFSTDKKVLSDAGEAFAKFGFQNSYSGFHETLLNEVADHVIPMEMDETAFLEVVARMKSAKFMEREGATKEINDSFENWEPLIAKYSKDENQSPEIRSRLKKILNQNLSTKQLSARNLIEQKSLLEEPATVLEAWKASQANDKDAKHAKWFAERLRQLTKQEMGDSIEEWEEWVTAQSGAKPEAPAVPTPVTLTESKFPYFASEISRLCKLHVSTSGRLEFDRKSWAAYFGNRTPSQLADELREFAANNQIPRSWVSPGNNLQQTEPQHLLLRMIGDRCYEAESNQHAHRGFNYSNDKSETFQSPHLNGSLRMTPGRVRNAIGRRVLGNLVPKSEFINLKIGETYPSGPQVQIYENNSVFSMLLVAPADGALLFVRSSEEGFLVHDLRPDAQFSVSTASFSEFVKEHREYFENSFCQSLAAFCIDLSEAGGLEEPFSSKPLDDLKTK